MESINFCVGTVCGKFIGRGYLRSVTRRGDEEFVHPVRPTHRFATPHNSKCTQNDLLMYFVFMEYSGDRFGPLAFAASGFFVKP